MKYKDQLFLITLGAFSAITVGGIFYFFNQKGLTEEEKTLGNDIKNKNFQIPLTTPDIPNEEEQQLTLYMERASTYNLNINNATINVSSLFQLVEQVVGDKLLSLRAKHKILKQENKNLSQKLKVSQKIINKLIGQIGDMKLEQVDLATNLVDVISVISNEPISYAVKKENFSQCQEEKLTELINLFSADEKLYIGSDTLSYLQILKERAVEVECLGELVELSHADIYS